MTVPTTVNIHGPSPDGEYSSLMVSITLLGMADPFHLEGQGDIAFARETHNAPLVVTIPFARLQKWATFVGHLESGDRVMVRHLDEGVGPKVGSTGTVRVPMDKRGDVVVEMDTPFIWHDGTVHESRSGARIRFDKRELMLIPPGDE